jgi:predicted phage terminase large subunit-like protein
VLTADDLPLLTQAELIEVEARMMHLANEQEALDREEQRALYEANLSAFIQRAWQVIEPGTPLLWSWHYELLCEFLTQMARGAIRRGVVNVPPRTAKSNFCTICLPCWVWTWQPEYRFVVASHAADLAIEHSVKRRLLLESEWYTGLWDRKFRLSSDQNQKHKFTNTSSGSMFATSVNGRVTGSGGQMLILDDGLSPKQANSEAETASCINWIDNTWMSRFNNPATGVALIVEQRTSLQDPTGSRLAKEPGVWKLLSIPLVAEKQEQYIFPVSGEIFIRREGDVLMPERFTDPVVKSIQGRSRVYQTQYQQSPSVAGGSVYKYDWWKYYTALPSTFDEILNSWDMAFKATSDSDYVVGQAWGRKGANHYLLYQIRGKLSFTETRAAVLTLKARFPQTARVLIEAKANGPAIVSALQGQVTGLIEVEPQGSKYARAEASSADVESGNVWLQGPEEAPPQYVLDFVAEHSNFTGNDGEEDDQVDAQSQYLNWQRMRHNNIADAYGKMATAREAEKEAKRLTPQQVADAQPAPWSVEIRTIAMGIMPTTPVQKWELQRWALDCKARGDNERAAFAEDILSRL